MTCRTALLLLCLGTLALAHAPPQVEPEAEGPDDISKREADEKEINEIKANLQTIKDQIESALETNKEPTRRAKGLLRAIDQLKNDVGTKIKKGDISALGTAASSVSGAITKIKGTDDPFVVAQAITDTLSTVTGMLPPPVGTAVSTVLSIVSCFLGLGIAKTPKIQDVVEDIVKKAIDKEHLRNLNEEVNGAKLVFSQSTEILLVYEGYDWSTSEVFQRQNDMMFLGQQVKITEGLPLFGKLEYYINDEIEQMKQTAKQTDKVVAKESVEKLLKLVLGYSQLFALRQSLLHSMRSVYSSAKGTVLADEAIQRLFEVSQLHAENFLKFLHYPSEETVFFMTSEAMATGSPLYNALKGLGIDVKRNSILGDGKTPVCGYIQSVFPKLGDKNYFNFEVYRQSAGTGTMKLVPKSQRSKFHFAPGAGGTVRMRKVVGNGIATCDKEENDRYYYGYMGDRCSTAKLTMIQIKQGKHDGQYFIAVAPGNTNIVKVFERGGGTVGYEHEWVNPNDDTFFRVEKVDC